MAFPRAISRQVYNVPTGAATVLNPPPGVMAGDLLLCFAISRVVTTAVTISVGTWTTVSTDSNTTYSAIFARIADGTSADRITLNKANDDWCAVILRVVDHGVVDIATDIKVGTWAGNTSTTPDPPSLDAGSDDDWLWIAMAGAQLATSGATLSNKPTNYTTQYLGKSASSTTSVCMGVATRPLNGQTENPGTFTLSTSRAWRAQTIAIKPGTAVSGLRTDVSPQYASSTSNLTTSEVFTPPANCVLIAVAGIGNSVGSGVQTGVVSDSSANSWTKLDEYQAADGMGLTQIWGFEIGSSPAAMWVNVTGANNGQGTSLAVYSILGSKPLASILGAVDHAASNLESDTITLEAANSLVFACFSDANGTGTVLAGADMILDLFHSDATNGQKRGILHSASLEPAGSFTYSIEGVTGSQASFAAWEIKNLVDDVVVLTNQHWGIKV